jgi:microcystin-dependent protein
MNELKRQRGRRVRGAAYPALLVVLMIWSAPARAQNATEPYLGQIFAVAFDFAPKGFALCNGQLLPISQNQALFALLGTTYGGDGRTTFALPDLRGRVAMDADLVIGLGEKGGEEGHALTVSEMPAHVHQLNVSSGIGGSASPEATVIARDAGGALRYGPAPGVVMHPGAIGPTGGSLPHENRMPFVVVHYIIALQGIFPSRP